MSIKTAQAHKLEFKINEDMEQHSQADQRYSKLYFSASKRLKKMRSGKSEQPLLASIIKL